MANQNGEPCASNPRQHQDKRVAALAILEYGIVRYNTGFDYQHGERSKSGTRHERGISAKRLTLARDELYLRLRRLQNSDLDKRRIMTEIERMASDIDELRESRPINDGATEHEMTIESQLRIVRSM